MGIGIRIRKLWRLKLGVGISLAVALLAALWSVDKISLIPPGLTPRALEMATATTHVLVDTPDSIMIDLRQNTYDITGLVQPRGRARQRHREYVRRGGIAQRAHVPLGLLRIQAPLTPAQASLPVNSQSAGKVTDIVKSNDQYRIEIDANPEVPMLDIYAQTPTAESAAALANAAVDELTAYLARARTTVESTPPTRTRSAYDSWVARPAS